MLHNTFIFGGQKQKANSVEVTEAATRGEWLTRKEREMSSNSLAMEICEIWENCWLLHSNKKKTSSCVIVVSLKGSKQQKIKENKSIAMLLFELASVSDCDWNWKISYAFAFLTPSDVAKPRACMHRICNSCFVHCGVDTLWSCRSHWHIMTTVDCGQKKKS